MAVAEVVGPDVVVHVVQVNTKTDLGRQVNDCMAAVHAARTPIKIGDVVASDPARGRRP
jgi:CxxC motif-containing protein